MDVRLLWVKELPSDEFWLIGDRALAAGKNNLEEVSYHIWLQLKDEPREYVLRYYNRLVSLVQNLRRWDVWAASKAMFKPHEDEEFGSFCQWVILHGQEFYNQILVDADELADRRWLSGSYYKADGQRIMLDVLLAKQADHKVGRYGKLKYRWPESKLRGKRVAVDRVRELYPRLWARSRKAKVRKDRSLESVRGKFTEEHFWTIIDIALEGEGTQPENLTSVLTQLSKTRIRAFSELFESKAIAAYRWDIWGVVYLLLGGCGDDEFAYFRAWLVAQGKLVYERALADPRSIAELSADGDLITDESMLYAAAAAYEKVAGEELPPSRINLPQSPAGTEWTEEDLPKLFPGLLA